MYKEFINIGFRNGLNKSNYSYVVCTHVYSCYKGLIDKNNITPDKVEEFISDNDWIKTKINTGTDILYKQPIIYLLFYLVYYYQPTVESLWNNLDYTHLRSIINDCGRSSLT